MIYQYVVTLKNQQTRYLDILGLLLSLLSVLFFFREMSSSNNLGLVYLLGSVVILIILARNYYLSNYRNKKVYYSRAMLLAALVWAKMPYFQWLFFVFIALALLEYQAKYAIEIGFSDKEIVLNTLFKKRFNWSQFTNIVLKDGIITLDFKNNKVWQREIEDDEDDDADEDEFNAYCRERLGLVTNNNSTSFNLENSK
ncbi:MAG: hypothetical protein H7Y31_06540 [Chitinophagaceae bacterium]|nr:hypothetical protein [Chitinophagaceae bacterium]